MGTKQNPGINDAWEKAENDEPRWAALARDPLAPFLPRIWAAWVSHDIQRARAVFENGCVASSKIPYRPGKDSAHVIESRECANAMDLWRTEHSPRPKDVRAVRAELEAPAAPPVDQVDVGDHLVDMNGRPINPDTRAFLYKGFGDMIPLPEPWPRVTLENRTGPHAEAIDRWAVVIDHGLHKQKVVTVFEDLAAEERARDCYRVALAVHGIQTIP